MNGVLILTIAAMVYLILAAAVMDLLIELICHLLQSQDNPDLEEVSDSLQVVSSQDEQVRKIPSACAPGTQQGNSPCPPSPSEPLQRIPLSPWLLTRFGA